MEQHDPAPTIPVEVITQKGKTVVEVLPDSGADICAAGYNFLYHLGEDPSDLSVSNVTPKTVNGSKLESIGSLRSKVQLGHRSTNVRFHIYKGICGAVLSWKAAQSLGILPQDYPNQQINTNYFLKMDNKQDIEDSYNHNPKPYSYEGWNGSNGFSRPAAATGAGRTYNRNSRRSNSPDAFDSYFRKAETGFQDYSYNRYVPGVTYGKNVMDYKRYY